MSIQATKPNSKTFLLLGIVCAVIAAGLIWFGVSQSSGSSLGPLINVVVSVAPIAQSTPVTAQQVKVKSEPQSAVPVNALISTQQVIGQSLITTANPNTVLTQSMIISATNTVQASTALGCTNIPAELQKGTVAVAIPTTGNASGNLTGLNEDLMTAGNYITAGDHIDIIADNGSGNVRYLYQDLTVLCSGTPQETAGTIPTVFVVEVPRAEAETLTSLFTHISASGGLPVAVKYVIRPVSDYGKNLLSPNYMPSTTGASLPPVTDPPVTPNELESMFNNGQ